MEKEKLSFLKKVRMSIFDFDGYQRLAAEKISRTIGYIVLLILIFSIIISITYTFQFNGLIGNIREYINNEISEIKYENYELSVIPNNLENATEQEQGDNEKEINNDNNEQDPVSEQDTNNEQNTDNEQTIDNEQKVMKIDSNELIPAKIIINTETTDEEEIQANINEISSSQNGILILKNRIIIKNEFSTNLSEYTYKTISEQYNINKIDKTEILNMLSGQAINRVLTIFFITVLLYMFIIYVSTMLIDILLLVVLAYIVTRISGLKLKYSAIYNMASYSLTLPVILNIIYFVVNRLTGFTIEYFQIMYTALASIYIITAILMIKSDVIKKQIELNKIIEEQEKVKQELKRKEEERKEQEEQERRRQEREKRQKREQEKEKKENKEGGAEETPEGGNA